MELSDLLIQLIKEYGVVTALGLVLFIYFLRQNRGLQKQNEQLLIELMELVRDLASLLAQRRSARVANGPPRAESSLPSGRRAALPPDAGDEPSEPRETPPGRAEARDGGSSIPRHGPGSDSTGPAQAAAEGPPEWPASVRIHKKGSILVIAQPGKITIGRGDLILRQAIETTLKRGETRIVLDLAKTTYMDSSGIGEMVACYKRVLERGGTLKLVKPGGRVGDLLALTKLDDYFETYGTLKEAIASFDS